MKTLYLLLAASIFFSACNQISLKSDESYYKSDKITNFNNHKIPQISKEAKEEFLNAINAARADTQDCGYEGVFPPAPPLKWNDKLYEAAYEHSYDMAKSGVFSHEGSNTQSDWTAVDNNLGRGSHFSERITYHKYKYSLVAENVAYGTGALYSASDVVEVWLNSPGHCANLMNPNLKEVGMALYIDGNRNYWTQDFGSQE